MTRLLIKFLGVLGMIAEILAKKISIKFFSMLLVRPKAPIDLARGGRVLFITYGSPISRLLVEIVGSKLKSRGFSFEMRLPKQILRSYQKKWVGDFEDSTASRFDSITQTIDFLVASCGGPYFFKRGVIDEFVRRAPVAVLTGNYSVPKDFLDMAHKCLEEAREYVAKFDAVVVTSTGYLQKNTIVATAFEANIPVWVLSPFGGWNRIREDSTADYLDENPFNQALSLAKKDFSVVEQARQYFSRRLSGTGALDIDARLVYSAQGKMGGANKRKILFLHAIRDANHLPLKGSQPSEYFSSFLEWTEFALSEVASAPNDWWIKPHPQSTLFPDEEEIVSAMCVRAGVPLDIIRPDLDTAWVLENFLPVFTCRGTIALETASLGYRANVATEIYSDVIASVPKTMEALSGAFQAPIETAATLIPEPRLLDIAKVMLWVRFNLPLSGLVSSRVVWQTSNRVRNKVDEVAQTIELALRYMGPKAHGLADMAAEELVSSIGQSGRDRRILPGA